MFGDVFILLLGYTVHTGPATNRITLIVALAGSLEVGYRRAMGRKLRSG